MFFASQELVKWFRDVLPNLTARWTTEVRPDEQLDTLLAKYASGAVLYYLNDLKCLRSHGRSVWELRTDDVRIFGWFPFKDCFVGVVAGSAGDVKVDREYDKCIEQVVAFRDALDLNEPKFVKSEKVDDVISNFDYP